MLESDMKTSEQRITELQAQIEDQDAKIEALVSSIALLVLAQVENHDDVRIPRELGQYCTSNLDAARDGGTTRVPAHVFRSKGEVLSDLLNEIRGRDDFLSLYWIRSFFPWRDERRYNRIRRINAKIAQICDRVGI